jgi:catechol 2,3-dioxygenase-like lactoylglutathione lyase family enzyme
MLQTRTKLHFVGARKLDQRAERALDHVGRIPGLACEVLVAPPEGPLTLVNVAEPRLSEPAGEPRARIAPAGGGHAVNHRAKQRVRCVRRRLHATGRVIDLNGGESAAGDEHAPGVAQRRRRVADVLEQPHHPDVVEGLVRERQGKRVALAQGRLDSGSPEMAARELELCRLDVDADETQTGKLLSEHGQHRADATSDFEQACTGAELRAIRDQAMAPVLGLLDEPLLLDRPVSVDVLRHEPQTRPGAERKVRAVRKIQTQGVHHITLVGAKRQTSIDFWEGVLGMPFVFEQPNLDNEAESHLYFDPGDGRLITVFTDEAREPVEHTGDPKRPGRVHHLAFAVSKATFDQVVTRLGERGVENSGVKDRGFMDSIYFEDPLGLLIELAAYRFEPPQGQTHTAVLLEAHRLRVERGDHNIGPEHLADAIGLLVERSQQSLSDDRSPKQLYGD